MARPKLAHCMCIVRPGDGCGAGKSKCFSIAATVGTVVAHNVNVEGNQYKVNHLESLTFRYTLVIMTQRTRLFAARLSALKRDQLGILMMPGGVL